MPSDAIFTDNNSQVYSKVFHSAAVTTTNMTIYGGITGYWGCVTINMTDIQNYANQNGYTILGGNICKGPLNDHDYSNNICSNHGFIITMTSSYNIPYQIGIISDAYQTMHVEVIVYFKKQ